MAIIFSVIVFIQLNVVCLCSKPVYQRGAFPYSRCYQTYDRVSCERLNITKGVRQETPSQWPPGPYAVLMPNDLCPEPETSGWQKGVVSIKASTKAKSQTLYFCVKIKRYLEVAIDRGKWVLGTYNIYMSGLTCPDGFDGFNQSIAYESFSHSGHVPNFTTIDDSGRRSIVFYMCKHNSTDTSKSEDEPEYDTTYTEFLHEEFVNNESCDDLNGTSCYYVQEEFELVSEFLFSTGTVPKRFVEKNKGNVDVDVDWYQFDFQQTLPVSRIQMKRESFSLNIFKYPYIGCTWSNVKLDLLPPDAESCYETVHSNDFHITLKMSYIQTRYITLMFIRSEILQTLQPHLFQIFLFDLPHADICNEYLGVKDIQNFQIKASSWLHRQMHLKSRPLSDGWCADGFDSKPWILVDLIAVTRVEGLTIWLGSRNHETLFDQSTDCLSLNFFHGNDTDILTMYNDTKFKDNSLRWINGKTFVQLDPFAARYVKLQLNKCVANRSVCIRFELHGCKQSGIPDLNCSGESDMFELDREIRPEGNPVIYTYTHTHENCLALCYRSENCSVVNYNYNVNETYCTLYPASRHGIWYITDTLINQWSAKLCGKDHIELFPRLRVRGGEEIGYETLTNVEYITGNAVIHSIGYPFSYATGQNYMWIVDFQNPVDRFARLAFTNVSLGDQDCHAKLFVSKRMSLESQGIEINHRYNDRVFVIETEENLLFLTFTTCLGREGFTDRGFRAIVTAETIPACFSIERSNQDTRSETCKRQAMTITSLSILNLPFVGGEEIWTIDIGIFLHHSLQLEFLDFYVVCPNGTGDIRPRFVIEDFVGVRPYCNTARPPPVIDLESSNAIVKYQRHDISTTVYLRQEGFRLRYSLRDHSLENLEDIDSFSRVCSKTFGKCYHLEPSLKTWDEASRSCMECNMMLVSILSEYELQFVNYLLREFLKPTSINVPVKDKNLYQTRFSSHIGARHITNSQRKELYVWENTAPVINFHWRRGNPTFGKACVRTNALFLSNKTWESEDCSTDLSMYICQSPLVEELGTTPDLRVCDESTNMKFDIAVLIDTSASIWIGDFEMMRRFILDLVRKFSIGSDAIQIAALTFAKDVQIEFCFNDVNTRWKAEKQIENIEHRYGQATRTHLALEEMRLHLFSSTNGSRNNVPRIGLLLTDGRSTDPYRTAKEAELAKQDGIRLIAIGIGGMVDSAELNGIVSKPFTENLLQMGSFSDLDSNLLLALLPNTSGMGASKSSQHLNTVWTNWKRLETLNKTFSGTTCKTWTDLSTSEMHHLKTTFPDFMMSDDMYNFCQDPDSSGVLWCYIPGSGSFLWEPCFIQDSSSENQDDNDRMYSVENNATFTCDDGRNISIFQKCDGLFNCRDFSDETSCTKKAQYIIKEDVEYQYLRGKSTVFSCDSKEGISVSAKCDNVIDCADASDELQCQSSNKSVQKDAFVCDNPDCQICDDTSAEEQFPEFKECGSNEYECENKQCISKSKLCDTVRDCSDYSDENTCGLCVNGIRCGDFGKCIPVNKICNDIVDCDNGTDEEFCEHKSCKEWWKNGHYNSEYYRIDGLSVYCDFTSIYSGEITTVFRNIDVVLDEGKGLLYTVSGNNFTQFKDLPFHLNDDSCFIEVKKSYQFPKMASTIDNDVDKSLVHNGFCTIERFALDKNDQVPASNLRHENAIDGSGCNTIERSSSNDIFTYYYNVTRDGDFFVDERIWKGELPLQITPQQIVCNSESLEIFDFEAPCTKNSGLNTSECVYFATSARSRWECRYESRLQNCGQYITVVSEPYWAFKQMPQGKDNGKPTEVCSDYECPPDTVKCPGSYCIPLWYVCDGVFQCPNGEDEFECTCENEPREVLLFVEDINESKLVARKIAKQFYTADSDIRLLFFKTQTPLQDFDIEHRLLEIREERIYLSKILERSNEYQFKTMARNVLKQITFSKYNTNGVVFIENSFESSKVAELMFSNVSDPAFMIYRVFRDTSFTAKYDKPDKYRFVKDVPTHRWNALFNIGYKRFPEICKAATEVPCVEGYRCSSSKQCIPPFLVCDGTAQCPESDDERFCDYNYFCPYGCKCFGNSVNCRAGNTSIYAISDMPLRVRVVDLSQNAQFKDVLRFPYLGYFSVTKLNISSCEIESITNEAFWYLNDLKCLDIGNNKIKMLPEKVFSRLEKLVYLHLDGNSELQIISPSAFHGLKNIKSLSITGTKLKRISSETFSFLTLNVLNISHNQITEIEGFAFNGTSVKKIDFRENNILKFNEFIFEGVSLLEELHTPDFKFCCIRPCSVDEEKCFPERNEFSSCEDLMRHPVLQSMLWIVGSISLLGNLGSIFYRILYDRERLKIGYGIFVTNLAGADFLMGIYLIMIAIADMVFRNRYIYVDDMWRKSNWCLTAGILSTVSSEASVLFVCLITLDRLLVIKYPFGTVRFEPKKAYLFCFVSWMVSLVIAVIPVLYTDYFKNSFYSRSAVCIALPLTRDKPPGWVYSVSIFVGLNFCTFVLVAFGQLSIFLELRKATDGIKQTQKSRKRDLQVARNLIFVATTDFLCWFPIGLMGIMALSGHPIPGDVYAWTAVFILPLNSALNPVLYTLTAILGKRSFNPDMEEQNRTDTLKETASAIVQHHALLKLVHVHIKRHDKAPKWQNLEDFTKDTPLSSAMLVSIAFHLSKYMCFLHDRGVFIEQMSTDSIYLKVNKKKKRCISIYLDSKLCVSNDEKRLQSNIFQFGQLIRKLTAKCKQKKALKHF